MVLLIEQHSSVLQRSSVERSGAAQGLAEVLAVLGPSHVDALLPELLAACSSPMPFVREGNLTLFRFLPHTIPDVFQVRTSGQAPKGLLACLLSLVQYVSPSWKDADLIRAERRHSTEYLINGW